MQRQGDRECESRGLALAFPQEYFREAAQCPEMARFELYRTAKVLDALLVATEKVVQGGALVPRLSKIRKVAQEQRQPRLRNVIATRSDVACSQIQRMRRRAMGMVHPQVPNVVLRDNRLFHVSARTEAKEQGVERSVFARRAPAASIGDEPKSLCVCSHQLRLMLALSVKIARAHSQTAKKFVVVEQSARYEMHDLAFALDYSLHTK